MTATALIHQRRISDVSYKILEWDSGMFGFPVARLLTTGDRNMWATALETARRSGVRLVYGQTPDEEMVRAAEKMGGILVSERLTYWRDLPTQLADLSLRVDLPVNVERWSDDTPTHELLRLGRDAGRFSRFRVDSGVSEEVFGRIYEAWVTNSVTGHIAEEVMVTRDASMLTGLVTVGVRNGRAEIGLLSVHEEARGRGVGRALVHAALEWAVHRRFGKAQVVTQRANVAACRLYESSGYTIERAEHVLHFWL